MIMAYNVSEAKLGIVWEAVAAIVFQLVDEYEVPASELRAGPGGVTHVGTRVEVSFRQARSRSYHGNPWGKQLYADLGKFGKGERFFHTKKGGFDLDRMTIEFGNAIKREQNLTVWKQDHADAVQIAERTMDKIVSEHGHRSPMGPYGWAEYAGIKVGDFEVYTKIRTLGPELEPGLDLRIVGLNEDQTNAVFAMLRDL